MNGTDMRAVLPVGMLALGLLTGCGTSDPAGSSPTTTLAPPSPSASTSPTTRRGGGVIDLGDGSDYRPAIDPAQFVEKIDNRYLPLTPGSRWVYQGEVDGERERIELEVTTERKTILGISAVGVRDTNYVNDERTASTTDWYAQDRGGNVWYLGENTQTFENGAPAGTEGWEAGIDGAQPGIFMPAHPTIGTAYRQAFRRGQVEDSAEVLRTGVAHTTGLASYTDVIVIRGWSRLDPEIIEEKYYAPGVGKIYETLIAGGKGGTELIGFTPVR